MAPVAPVSSSSVVRWTPTEARDVELELGDASPFEQSDAAIIAAAEREVGGAIEDSTRADWRTALADARRDKRLGVTLSRFVVNYRWSVGRDGLVARITFESSGVAVRIVGKKAPAALRSHESGHAALHAAALALGERLATLAMDPLRAAPPTTPQVEAAANAAVSAIGDLEGLLHRAFDAASDHKGPRALAERLAAATVGLLERQPAGRPLAAVMDAMRTKLRAIRSERAIRELEVSR